MVLDMGSTERRKGHQFEREVVRELKEKGIDARRILEFQQEQANGVDVETPDLIIQCKNMKVMPNIPRVFSQFKRDDKTQVVAFRITNKGTYMAMRLEDMLEMLSHSQEKPPRIDLC